MDAEEETMTKHDRIISYLIDALDAIQRTALSDNTAACMRIHGMASQAIEHTNNQRERNTDGYLVVRVEEG